MSRKNNVNPDHYKVAGRERPSEPDLHNQGKHGLNRAAASRRGEGQPAVLPGASRAGMSGKAKKKG